MEYGCEFQILSNELNEKLFRKRTPLSGGIELTSKCNFKCIHCYETVEREAETTEMLSLERLYQIIDELERMGCISVFLTGGEAMLDKRFDGVYKYLREKGIMVAILSNGTAVTKEKCEMFREFQPRMIDISLYGASEKTYEKVTKMEDGYAKFINGVELLKKNKIPFQLKAIILNENVEELNDMREIAQRYQVPIKLFTYIRPYNNGTKLPMQHMLSNNEIIDLESKDPYICEHYRKKKQSYVLRGLSERQRQCNTYLCRIAQNSFFITYDGVLNGCVRSRNHGYDLVNGSFQEGWEYLYKTFVIPKEKEEFACSKCELMNYCDFCPGEFEMETGNPTIAPQNLCNLAHLRREKFG